MEEGREEGETRLLVGQICRKLRKGQSVSAIAEMLEENEAYIQEICRIAEPFAPDYDENKVYETCAAKKSGKWTAYRLSISAADYAD